MNISNGIYQQAIFTAYQKNYNSKGNHENNYDEEFDEYL